MRLFMFLTVFFLSVPLFAVGEEDHLALQPLPSGESYFDRAIPDERIADILAYLPFQRECSARLISKKFNGIGKDFSVQDEWHKKRHALLIKRIELADDDNLRRIFTKIRPLYFYELANKILDRKKGDFFSHGLWKAFVEFSQETDEKAYGNMLSFLYFVTHAHPHKSDMYDRYGARDAFNKEVFGFYKSNSYFNFYKFVRLVFSYAPKLYTNGMSDEKKNEILIDVAKAVQSLLNPYHIRYAEVAEKIADVLLSTPLDGFSLQYSKNKKLSTPLIKIVSEHCKENSELLSVLHDRILSRIACYSKNSLLVSLKEIFKETRPLHFYEAADALISSTIDDPDMDFISSELWSEVEGLMKDGDEKTYGNVISLLYLLTENNSHYNKAHRDAFNEKVYSFFKRNKSVFFYKVAKLIEAYSRKFDYVCDRKTVPLMILSKIDSFLSDDEEGAEETIDAFYKAADSFHTLYPSKGNVKKDSEDLEHFWSCTRAVILSDLNR